MWRTILKFIGLFILLPLIYLHLWLCPRNKQQARFIRSLIQCLGVIPIKICQWYSNMYFYQYSETTRPILLDELYTLQEACRTHKASFTRQTLEASVHGSDLVIDWEEMPIASGSIAQVHRATLCNGKEAVLKICHPNVKRDYNEWVRVIQVWIHFLSWFPAWINMGNLKTVMIALEN